MLYPLRMHMGNKMLLLDNHAPLLFSFIAQPIATAYEDYLPIDMNVTFVSGQNSTGDNQQCVFIPLIDDTTLEGNETFNVLINTTADDDDVVNITAQVITVTIEEDSNDCKDAILHCIIILF